MLRVVLDTNLWISYLISKRLRKLDDLIVRKELVLLFSDELLEEFIEVARRPKFKRYFTSDALGELFSLFDEFGEIINVRSKVDLCRDPNDNFLLALAKDGAADYLVTGDEDLLIIKRFGSVKILSFSEFIERSK